MIIDNDSIYIEGLTKSYDSWKIIKKYTVESDLLYFCVYIIKYINVCQNMYDSIVERMNIVDYMYTCMLKKTTKLIVKMA